MHRARQPVKTELAQAILIFRRLIAKLHIYTGNEEQDITTEALLIQGIPTFYETNRVIQHASIDREQRYTSSWL